MYFEELLMLWGFWIICFLFWVVATVQMHFGINHFSRADVWTQFRNRGFATIGKRGMDKGLELQKFTTDGLLVGRFWRSICSKQKIGIKLVKWDQITLVCLAGLIGWVPYKHVLVVPFHYIGYYSGYLGFVVSIWITC